MNLASWMQAAGVNTTPATCADAVAVVARERSIHPVRNYLEGLAWDGVARLGTMLVRYFGAVATGADEASPEEVARRNGYLTSVSKCTMKSAVARAYSPGCKVDHVPVLKSPQGAGKSSAIARLCPDPGWFSDEIAEIGTKDSAQDLAGKWIIELAELAAMRKADREKMKAFITRSTDHYRPSYARRSEDFLRHCIFIGTTNADEFLTDEIGNRRFWPVTVRSIDLEAIDRDRDQLWAEAVVLFKAGEQWWFDQRTETIAAEIQSEHVARDPWHATVMRWAVGVGGITIEATLRQLGIETSKQTQRDRNRVAAILKTEKWQRRQRRQEAKGGWVVREWFYASPDDIADPADAIPGDEPTSEGWSDEI